MNDALLLEDLPSEPIAAKVMEVIEGAFTRHADGEDYLAGMRMAVPGVGELISGETTRFACSSVLYTNSTVAQASLLSSGLYHNVT